MAEQIPSSIPAQPEQNPAQPEQFPFTPERLEAMKQQARELAIQQAIAQRAAQQQMMSAPAQPSQAPTPAAPAAPSLPDPVPARGSVPAPNIVYLRRNLTVAEVLIVFAIAIGLVTGTQFVWNVGSDFLSRIEIREK